MFIGLIQLKDLEGKCQDVTNVVYMSIVLGQFAKTTQHFKRDM